MVQTSLGTAGASSVFASSWNLTSEKKYKGYVTSDESVVNFYSEAVQRDARVLIVADTHLFIDDERGVPFAEYSGRMSKAYNTTLHFESGEVTNPTRCFAETLERGKSTGVDLVVLLGDIFSWPSEAAIEWAQSQLTSSGLPFIYVAGNHDWHYEGMPGPSHDLRSTWINKRLLPMYQKQNPLMDFYDVHGIRFVTIDNSTYEITDAQLRFFEDMVRSGKPLVVLAHIPMFAPGRSVSFGCGHPDWGASSDRVFEIERRPRWRESGHTRTTTQFYKSLVNANNVLGIFSGHIHKPSIDFINGIPQFVADDNASGGYLEINLRQLSPQYEALISG